MGGGIIKDLYPRRSRCRNDCAPQCACTSLDDRICSGISRLRSCCCWTLYEPRRRILCIAWLYRPCATLSNGQKREGIGRSNGILLQRPLCCATGITCHTDTQIPPLLEEAKHTTCGCGGRCSTCGIVRYEVIGLKRDEVDVIVRIGKGERAHVSIAIEMQHHPLIIANVGTCYEVSIQRPR